MIDFSSFFSQVSIEFYKFLLNHCFHCIPQKSCLFTCFCSKYFQVSLDTSLTYVIFTSYYLPSKCFPAMLLLLLFSLIPWQSQIFSKIFILLYLFKCVFWARIWYILGNIHSSLRMNILLLVDGELSYCHSDPAASQCCILANFA